MPYVLRVEPHPIGVVVISEDQSRELLIEGDTCCGVPFVELQHIANTSRKFLVDDETAKKCRLKRL